MTVQRKDENRPDVKRRGSVMMRKVGRKESGLGVSVNIQPFAVAARIQFNKDVFVRQHNLRCRARRVTIELNELVSSQAES